MICLVVDDDTDDQEIFSLAMEDVGNSYQCVFANNGYDALHSLSKKEIIPDFIFLDLNMPRINGLECLEEIKKIPWLEQVPVVIYSTSAEKSYVEKALEMGATTFITKLPSISSLSDALNNFFVSTSNSPKDL